MTQSVPAAERRKRQRFAAKRRGAVCFWVLVDDRRFPLFDLSLEGFAMPGESSVTPGQPFDFVLQRDGSRDEIRGRARVMTLVRTDQGRQAGCRFEIFDHHGRSRLEDWLTAHVMSNASVPITEQDAIAIVSGPSIV